MVAAEVKRGGSLSDAMGKAPAVFDAPYRALVATGETAGALPVCLERYQDYVDLRQKTTQPSLEDDDLPGRPDARRCRWC